MACDCDDGFAGARCERNVGLDEGGGSDGDPGTANQCKGELSNIKSFKGKERLWLMTSFEVV